MEGSRGGGFIVFVIYKMSGSVQAFKDILECWKSLSAAQHCGNAAKDRSLSFDSLSHSVSEA